MNFSEPTKLTLFFLRTKETNLVGRIGRLVLKFGFVPNSVQKLHQEKRIVQVLILKLSNVRFSMHLSHPELVI